MPARQVFIRDEYKQVIIDSLKFCQKERGLEIYAYVIMTIHIHIIIGRNGTNKLEDIVRDFKSFTSRSIRKLLEDKTRLPESRREWICEKMYKAGKANSNNNDFQLWQQNNHPIELSTIEMIYQRLEYVHNNPVEAGFIDDPRAWIWSSCAAYEKGVEGKLDLIFIE